jgi:hypothetical protein
MAATHRAAARRGWGDALPCIRHTGPPRITQEPQPSPYAPVPSTAPHQLSEAGKPGQQGAIVARCGRELSIRQLPADLLDHCGMTGVAVRVEAADDLPRCSCRAGGPSFSLRRGAARPPVGRPDKTMTGVLHRLYEATTPVRPRALRRTDQADESLRGQPKASARHRVRPTRCADANPPRQASRDSKIG